MLGRYPFVEPSRCRSRTQGEEQLEKILKEGVTTFVSLQAEIPPQEEMKIGGKAGFLPYKATAELIQASMNGPPPMEVVNGLRNPGLNKFLPPKKQQAEWQTYYKPTELKFVHSPIVDLGVPSETALKSLVDDLQARVEAGEKLYIHCWGGRGRAGTVGACLLAKMYGLSADEALERIQRAFDTRKDSERRSPETDEQHALVRAYVQGLSKASA